MQKWDATFSQEESKEMLDLIIRSKHEMLRGGGQNIEKQELKKIKGDVEQAYEGYYENKEQLYRIVGIPLSEEQRTALVNAYVANPAVIRALRKKYISAARDCPYCAMGFVKKLDHYLPKQKFPEFSMLDANLIPSCSDCNEEKGEKWDCSKGIIINPFFHEIPTQQILKARLHKSGHDSIPSVIFYIDDATDADVGAVALFRSHCEKLKLITSSGCGRYMSKATTQLTTNLHSLKNFYDTLSGKLAPEVALKVTFEFLEKEIRSSNEINGINHWETALWCAIKDARTELLAFFEEIENQK